MRTVTMSFYINNLVKGFYQLTNLSYISEVINVTTVEVLVLTFINSTLDFCNSLLHGLPKYEINKLQSVQNAAVRVIACLMHQSIPPVPRPPPLPADPRELAFFLPWMVNSRGWGLLSWQIPRSPSSAKLANAPPPGLTRQANAPQ